MYHIVMLETLVCSEHSYSTTLDLVGRQIWRGALLLADFVLHHGPSLLHGRTVLELGSGVGLTSIVAAMFATEVICTGDMNFIVYLYTASWHHLHVCIYIYFFPVSTIFLPGILECMLSQLNSLYLMLSDLFMLMSLTDHAVVY
jgi:Predicted methyltransferase